MNEKELWNRLAIKNYKYYIYSDKGKNVTDVEFDESGERDYIKFISDDNIINNKFPNKNKITILEIGCGAGRLLKPMSRDFEKVIGVDISELMIFQIKQRIKNLNNIIAIVTDGQSIPLLYNSVDLVFSYTVFQHIKNYTTIENNFKNIYKILKPSCIFKVLLGCVKYKNMDSWWSGICFTEEMIDDLINISGYKLLKREYTLDNRVWLWLEK